MDHERAEHKLGPEEPDAPDRISRRGRLLVGVGTFAHALDALGQTRTGRAVYQFACAACHGSDGSGAPAVESGYPLVPPDLSDCNFSTSEPAADWVGVSHHGGPNRAFSPLMPAFGEALSRQEIELAVSHARSFCTEEAWPRGELNFPRALVTTKPFPEDEAVLTVIAADGVATNTFVYEKRVGPRSMLEVTRRWSSPRALQETRPVASAIWASRSSSVEGVRTAAREPVDVGIARSGCSFTS